MEIQSNMEMFTKEDMDIEFDIKLLTTGYLEGTVCLSFFFLCQTVEKAVMGFVNFKWNLLFMYVDLKLVQGK